MEGQSIRGAIRRGKFSRSCVCPVTAAYTLLYDKYCPPKIANSVSHLVGLTKTHSVQINLACDYECESHNTLRQYAVQSLIWNFES